ncbi:Dolichyl-diphosphooligosaccharide--protein glycosyltransferase subunit-like protein [Hapsidospora chrysogenum ATCC 11550]|uniref:Dolichyl-diphosphooligosaccharide--protein glycosyltransferase subunit OST2 n=1 Tax=Hapsidospora chrysogenum (strain ATCC 11550 / CBS 779.69 / DSM 880 / IAM 14645 / JCM 23072 / IMI 49137) TaxID=857340 RepID=A0A086TCY4_HAPC1|nr:Dolichyl-diphosphooligosaccharide--protein glycosyltransferase subunit-like protein [Hapsidospora chrysogenum ATCC 11550]
MAPKKNAREPTPAAAGTTQASATAAGSVPLVPKPKATSTGAANWDKVLQNIYNYYMTETPQRTKLLDVFLVFLAAVGALQFLYCILAGNYPFNAFLSGFCGTVGQFVLTISLRIQTTKANKAEFPKVSPERAFADYVVCSLILHFFCVNFIN